MLIKKRIIIEKIHYFETFAIFTLLILRFKLSFFFINQVSKF